MNLREKVARAILAKYPVLEPWEQTTEDRREAYMEEADAAIAAVFDHLETLSKSGFAGAHEHLVTGGPTVGELVDAWLNDARTEAQPQP